MGHVVTTMGIAEECFRTIRRPFHGPAADALGGPDAHDFFAIDEDFGPKATAHIRCDHPQLVLRSQSMEGGDHEARHVGVLAGRIECVVVRPCIIGPNGRTGFHGVGNQAVVDQVHLGHVGR